MQSRAEYTVARILDAAERLFVARNYADVTMDEIARQAEVTKGALYHHFESKEALYLAMLHADLDAKRDRFREGVLHQGTTRDCLRSLTAAFFRLPPRKRALIGLVRRDINIFRGAARDRLVRHYQAALPDQVAEILRDGIRRGEIRPADPRLLAWQFVALVEVVLTPYAASKFPTDDEKLDYVLDVFLDGCGRPLTTGVNR